MIAGFGGAQGLAPVAGGATDGIPPGLYSSYLNMWISARCDSILISCFSLYVAERKIEGINLM
jgi:hypothetical protein